MYGAVERLASEGLLVHGAVGVAVEHAADAVFELDDAPGRLRDEKPREFLVVQEGSAADGVGEMALERIGGIEHRVVAALHHARASTLAEQPLDHYRDVEIGRMLLRMQRRHQPRAACTEDENVRVEGLDLHRL